ncbi:MAG: UvrD-helicase domain-containing protein [Candidatus Roizmanbacteria bacterium]|nr:UvrD-helicase domain-containing protein [Candidatus Roizmanbacteria bacterium]
MELDILRHLNKKQKESVINCSGPTVILAGAGSGKTRVLVTKVIYLIKEKKILPSSIVMLTFTNKAAAEMKERIVKQLGGKGNLGFVGTYHSFCVRILRQFWEPAGLDKNFIIYDDGDQKTLLKQIITDRKLGKKTPGYFSYYISLAKNQMITPETFLENFKFHQAALVADVYFHYQKKMTANRGVDFDDLLIKTVQLFQKHKQVIGYLQNKFHYFLVDEFQDTNFVQYLLTKLLADRSKNVTVVGDFSQSIYSWRGADITNLKKFEKDFPGAKTFYLEENYRSTQKILDFAFNIISKNNTHPILHLFTDNKPGEDIAFYQADNEQEEAIYVAEEITRLINVNKELEPPNFAILYRTNAQSRVLEEVLLRYGMPYILVGGTRFYERKEIKDILAYLKLLINPNESVSLERIKKLGKTRFSKFKTLYDEIKDKVETITTEELMEKVFESVGYLKMFDSEDEEDFSRLENIKELKSVAVSFPKLMDFLEQVALVESEYSQHEKETKDNRRLVLMTLHQAKGLEFDHVFIVGVEEGLLPHSRSIDDQFQLEEERRLFYVGITRAKKALYITNTRKRFIFGSQGYSVPSRFITDEDVTYI